MSRSFPLGFARDVAVLYGETVSEAIREGSPAGLSGRRRCRNAARRVADPRALRDISGPGQLVKIAG